MSESKTPTDSRGPGKEATQHGHWREVIKHMKQFISLRIVPIRRSTEWARRRQPIGRSREDK